MSLHMELYVIIIDKLDAESFIYPIVTNERVNI